MYQHKQSRSRNCESETTSSNTKLIFKKRCQAIFCDHLNWQNWIFSSVTVFATNKIDILKWNFQRFQPAVRLNVTVKVRFIENQSIHGWCHFSTVEVVNCWTLLWTKDHKGYRMCDENMKIRFVRSGQSLSLLTEVWITDPVCRYWQDGQWTNRSEASGLLTEQNSRAEVTNKPTQHRRQTNSRAFISFYHPVTFSFCYLWSQSQEALLNKGYPSGGLPRRWRWEEEGECGDVFSNSSSSSSRGLQAGTLTSDVIGSTPSCALCRASPLIRLPLGFLRILRKT